MNIKMLTFLLRCCCCLLFCYSFCNIFVRPFLYCLTFFYDLLCYMQRWNLVQEQSKRSSIEESMPKNVYMCRYIVDDGGRGGGAVLYRARWSCFSLPSSLFLFFVAWWFIEFTFHSDPISVRRALKKQNAICVHSTMIFGIWRGIINSIAFRTDFISLFFIYFHKEIYSPVTFTECAHTHSPQTKVNPTVDTIITMINLSA